MSKENKDSAYYGEKLRAPPDFDGPIKSSQRRVTDPFCFVLLCAAWGAFGFVGIYALQHGNPERIVHPSDYKGRLCGFDSTDANSTNATTLPPKWAPVDFLGNGACVEACSNVTGLTPNTTSELICKEENDLLNMTACLNPLNGKISTIPEQLILCGGCMYPLASYDTPLDYCLPRTVSDVMTHVEILVNQSGLPPLASSLTATIIPHFERLVSDLYTTRKVVLGMGLGASSGLGLAYLIFLRVPGLVSAIFWLSALAIPTLSAVGGYYAGIVADRYEAAEVAGAEMEMGGSPSDGSSLVVYFFDAETTLQILRGCMYLGYVMAGVLVTLMCLLRRRINLAIGITRAAARSIMSVPLTILYPVVQLIGYLAFFIPWFVVLLLLGTTGELTDVTVEVFEGLYPIDYTVTTYPKMTIYGFWYLIFILFWTSQFIVAIGQITVAIAFSGWYFTSDKSNRRIGCGTFPSAMCVAFWKHAGTAAFGSLIVAIVQFVRALLLWVEKKVKEIGGEDNKCIGVMFCCCQCLLLLLQKCLQYISKNAYIQTAIFGYPFCKGAQEAFCLILRNSARMATVSLISEMSMILCKLFVVTGVSLGAFYVISEEYEHYIFSVVGSVVIVAIISWFVADMFTEVLGIAISTILQCFLADEEMFGKNGSVYVPKELGSFLRRIDEAEDFM